ncbi:MAG: tRNA 2-thiocytidine biosynthesis protein TtcA [Desulfovibrio sp.]|nr:MAG: tRNA 2-thiocytidine biosynthesis protein TtcA [Desulfovibrio sp.]
MARGKKLTYAQKNCVASAGKLMHQTNMVSEGSRIGVALSGGMDSFTLLQVLRHRQRTLPFPIELMVLHVNPGFAPDNHASLLAWTAKHGLAAHMEVSDHGPRAHSEENRSNSPCFLCCNNRRKRLFELCDTYNLTHLAFGHIAEDLVTTFFLNLFQAGRVEGLGMKESFFQGKLTVIRPLLWLEKSVVRRAAAAWNLPIIKNPCPSAHTAKRSQILQWLEEKFKDDPKIKGSVYGALRRLQLDTTMKRS